MKRNFKEALKFAEMAKMADSKANILYTNLAIAYLFNNNWEKAKDIYQTWMDSSYNFDNRSMKSGFLEDINTMEWFGITHPDFEKVKELIQMNGKNE